MNSTERFRQRKKDGLCVYCGKNAPRPGKCTCMECAVKSSMIRRETYAYKHRNSRVQGRPRNMYDLMRKGKVVLHGGKREINRYLGYSDKS